MEGCSWYEVATKGSAGLWRPAAKWTKVTIRRSGERRGVRNFEPGERGEEKEWLVFRLGSRSHAPIWGGAGYFLFRIVLRADVLNGCWIPALVNTSACSVLYLPTLPLLGPANWSGVANMGGNFYVSYPIRSFRNTQLPSKWSRAC